MENQNTNTLKEVKTVFTKEVVKENLIKALNEISKIASEREYVVRGSIEGLISEINLDNSTLSSRKKIARKTYYFMKKKTLRTATALISKAKKFLAAEYELSIKPSILEQEINKMRSEYKQKRIELEVLRLALKERKKLLNEKKSSHA